MHVHQFKFLNLIQFAEVCSCPSSPVKGFTSGCNVTGGNVEYSCMNGYYLVGANTRTCQTGGYWTGSAPTCEAGTVFVLISLSYWFLFSYVIIETSCSCPPPPTNGSRNCSGSNEVPAYSRLYYKCNSGYHVVGDEYRTCHPSGSWTGSHPVCKKGKNIRFLLLLLATCNFNAFIFTYIISI